MTKKILQEVNIIRPIVIFLLVLLHSFAIFYGGWELPDGVTDIKLYHYLPCIIRGFRIETIAFIAGYVFSYQSNDLGRTYTLFDIIKKKFVRLIIPCWVFGTVYALCFRRADSIISNAVSILNGIGHLWFLTMLFWCFVSLFYIDRYFKKNGFGGKGGIMLFLCLSAISCIPPIGIPSLGLNRMPHFLFYTYLGYLFYLHKDKIIDYFQSKSMLIFTLYLIFVGLSFFITPYYLEQQELHSLNYFILYLLLKISQYLMAFSGITFLYIIVMRFLRKKGQNYILPNIVTASNKMCYGVYVFHQFLLIYIYDYSPIPAYINSYLLPYVALITTLSLSILLSKIFLMTRLGRYLIG